MSMTMEQRLSDQIATLAIPLLEARRPKDPRAVVQILRLAAEHEISQEELSQQTGLSRKTLRYYAQGRTSSGRKWPALVRAMRQLGLEPKARRGSSMSPPRTSPGSVTVPAGDRLLRQLADSVRDHKAGGRQDAAEDEPEPDVEVDDDGAIVTRHRPGTRGYAELLRHLVGGRGRPH